MRSPADMDIVVIDINNRCFLNCSNCTRLIAHQPSTRNMSLEQFKAAVESMRGWDRPGRVLGIIGGEPTLHPQFEEIARLFQRLWGPPGDLISGRQPIPRETYDKRMARVRLYDRSNGRGLWTSIGPRFLKHLEAICDVFSHWNTNDHSQGGRHQAALVDAREMCEALGIPWSDFPMYRDACWVQNTWSASITPHGAYFCEFAGQLDGLYNGGANAWPVEPGWWRRTPSQFGDQLKLCEMCSLCLPGPARRDSLDRDLVGAAHAERLVQIGSPAAKKGRLDVFDPARDVERRAVTTKDNYTAESKVRVAADNVYLLTGPVTMVVTCVGRSDHLRKTLAHNAELVDEVLVVTSLEDEETQRLRLPPNAQLLVVPSMPRGFAFNKGKLINAALVDVRTDWVLLTDADVYLHPGLDDFLHRRVLNPGCLYYTSREESRVRPENHEPNGYFQLFSRLARSIRDRWPAVMSEEFCSAGGVDSWFAQQFDPSRRIGVAEIPVRHVDHESDWNGARRPGTWRQCGMINAAGQYIQVEKAPPGNRRFRLVDTLHARAWEGEVPNLPPPTFPPEVLRRAIRGLVFLDEPIGDAHVHVAYWYEGDGR